MARPRRSSATYRQQLVAKHALPEPVIRLLVRLNDLGIAGEFTDGDAAWRVVPDDEEAPSLRCRHAKCGDKRIGELGVCRQRLSAQLTGREDKLSPPAPQLVQAYIELYLERAGADEATARTVQREINTLYQAADRHAAQEKNRRREQAAAEGRRDATATLRHQARELTELRDELAHRSEELERARDQIHALSAELGQQDAQFGALRTEINDLRSQLTEQDDQLHRVRVDEQHARRGAETYHAQALQLRAEADQLEGRIAELEAHLATRETTSSAATSGNRVRQEGHPDNEPPAAGPRPAGPRHRRAPSDRVLYRPSYWKVIRQTQVASLLVTIVAIGVGWLAQPSATVLAECARACVPALLIYAAIGQLVLWFGCYPRVTDRALRLGRGRAYPWTQIGQLTRVSNFNGAPTPGPVPCPKCGQACIGGVAHAVAGLEVHARNGAVLHSINLDYLANPRCPRCTPIDPMSGTRTDNGPVGLEAQTLLILDWPRFTEMVGIAAPHVVITDRDLRAPHRPSPAPRSNESSSTTS